MNGDKGLSEAWSAQTLACSFRPLLNAPGAMRAGLAVKNRCSVRSFPSRRSASGRCRRRRPPTSATRGGGGGASARGSAAVSAGAGRVVHDRRGIEQCGTAILSRFSGHRNATKPAPTPSRAAVGRILAAGADADAFLQGQLTQDLKHVQTGTALPAGIAARRDGCWR